ncbi:hypothetical protein CLOM_g22689 [Closterium sp. NIES-68]|nr:hypothetical protein CLOM_g22689 [Closterium sp. NIES-68]GJP82425.1 hypothetical protein CLOP_g12686 [Closterium sp. NIES-67]
MELHGSHAPSTAPPSSPSMARAIDHSTRAAAASFLRDELPQVLARAAELAAVEDPETEPYRSKYAAATALEASRGKADMLLRVFQAAASPHPATDAAADAAGAGREDTARASDLADAVAVLDYKRGALAADVDEVTRAKSLLTAADAQLQLNDAKHLRSLIDVCNLLGLLTSNDDDHKASLAFLVRAHKYYHRYLGMWSQAAGEVMEEGGEGRQGGEEEAREVESLHTITTFYLAQTLAAMGKKRRAAAFCAATLTRQLRLRQQFRAWDWAQNCAQLAGYYLGRDEFTTALHCLAAASTVVARHRAGQPVLPGGNGADTGGAGADAGKGDDEQVREVAANIEIGVGKVHLRVLQRSVELDAAQPDAAAAANPAATPTPAAAAASSTAAAPSSDASAVTAPSGAGAAAGSMEVDGGRREGQHEGDVDMGEGGEEGDGEASERWAGEGDVDIALGPDFSLLGLDPHAGTCARMQADGGGTGGERGASGGAEGEGEGDVVREYSHAVIHFNKAMAAFKAALEVYTSSDRFSDHFDIAMDISTLHRYLAYFEPSAHRAALIHQRRATRLLPLAGAINPSVYPSQAAQCVHELASIALNAMELEADAARAPAKIIEPGKQAIHYFDRFIALMQSSNPQDTDAARYVYAHFHAARTHYRICTLLPPQDGRDHLQHSLNYFSKFLEQAARMGLQEQLQAEVGVAKEMVQLLPTKLAADLSRLSIS